MESKKLSGKIRCHYIVVGYFVLSHDSETKMQFGLVNQFIGSSLVVTTIMSYTLKMTLTIGHVMSHIESSNSSLDHIALPLEFHNSSEVSFHSHILSYPLSMDHTQKTQFYCCVAQTTQKTSHVIAISPVHWHADCCLVTSYKHSSSCCVHVLQGVLSSHCLAVR
jgi:hypothetical protein